MKYKYIYLLLFFLSTSIAICQKNDSIKTFFAKTVDVFFIRDVYYLINISPLSSLSGYKSVYKEEGCIFVNYSGPLVQDKNYDAFWTIIDNKLCLYDVESIDFSDTKPKLDIKNMEDFLKTKFSKDNLPESIKKNERFKNGVIPAVWFSDTLYIKRVPRKEEDCWAPDYQYEPFTRLIFKEGRLIGKKTVTSMYSR
jgi:hypothetical protein